MRTRTNLGVTILAFAALAGCDFTSQETKSYDGQKTFQRVEVIVNVGDVTVRPSPDGQVHVDSLLTWANGQTKPTYVIEEDDSDTTVGLVLKIIARCDADERCAVDPQIELPADVDLMIDSGSGAVTVEGIRSSVTIASDFGDIGVTDVGGPLDLSAGSGHIEGRLLNSKTVIANNEGTNGRIDLEFVATPEYVESNTVSGDILYTVPAGPYIIDAASKTGAVQIENGIENATGTANQLLAHSVSGNITIQPPCELSHCN